MADPLDALRKDLKDLKDLLSKAFDSPLLKSMKQQADQAAESVGGVAEVLGGLVLPAIAGAAIKFDGLSNTLAAVAAGSLSAAGAFDALLSSTKNLSAEDGAIGASAKALNSFMMSVKNIDNLQAPMRQLIQSSINVGTKFGEPFEQSVKSIDKYYDAIRIARAQTYEVLSAPVRERGDRDIYQGLYGGVTDLANAGLNLEQIRSSFKVATQETNLLATGFNLATDSGLESNQVFRLMADSIRFMNSSIQDAANPLLRMQDLAQKTGIPIRELENTVYSLTKENTRFGLGMEGVMPIVTRFANVLGQGRIGFAARESKDLIDGLIQKVNTAEGAFIAMQGGLSKSGASIGEIMLDYESSLDKPEKLLKALTKTIGEVTGSGGKIITFEMAMENKELANTFKIQRDMLQQLLGVSNKQDQRDILKLMSDVASGREIQADGQRTLADAMKSAEMKNNETRSLQEKFGKATVDLLFNISFQLSQMANRAAPGQTTGSIAKRFEDFAQNQLNGILPVLNAQRDKLFDQLDFNVIDKVNKFIGGEQYSPASPIRFVEPPMPIAPVPVTPTPQPASGPFGMTGRPQEMNVTVALTLPSGVPDDYVITAGQLRNGLLQTVTGVTLT